MANNRTLTAANSILMIGVTGLFDNPIRIQGFATDDVMDTESMQPTETAMGVDGRLSAGWAPAPVVQNVTLQADSKSNDVFDQLISAERVAREKYVLFGSIVVPAIGRKLVMTRGFLHSFVKLPGIKRTLQPRRFTIHWEDVDGSAA
jgi:hypothetical protein